MSTSHRQLGQHDFWISGDRQMTIRFNVQDQLSHCPRIKVTTPAWANQVDVEQSILDINFLAINYMDIFLHEKYLNISYLNKKMYSYPFMVKLDTFSIPLVFTGVRVNLWRDRDWVIMTPEWVLTEHKVW